MRDQGELESVRFPLNRIRDRRLKSAKYDEKRIKSLAVGLQTWTPMPAIAKPSRLKAREPHELDRLLAWNLLAIAALLLLLVIYKAS